MGIVYQNLGDLITNALRELAVLRPDEVPKPAQMLAGVKRFNLFLDELSIGLANLFVETSDAFTLQQGVNPYPIGIGTAWNTAVPITVTQAFLTIGGVNYPIGVDMTEKEYYDIPIPTQQSQPTRLWFQPGQPAGNIYFDYVPDQNYPFTLFSFKALAKAKDQNAALAYPDGYESMLLYNFAVRSGPSFGKKPSDITVRMAERTLAAVESLNVSRTIEPADFSGVPCRKGGQHGSIYDMGMK